MSDAGKRLIAAAKEARERMAEIVRNNPEDFAEPYPMPDPPPERIFVWIGTATGNIRKWSREPFEEGEEYVRATALASKDAEIERLTGVLHRLSQFHGGSDDVRQVTKQVRQIAKAGLAGEPDTPTQAAGPTGDRASGRHRETIPAILSVAARDDVKINTEVRS